MVPDVNVLAGAFRTDHPQHVLCRKWLHDLLQSGEHFGLSPLVLAAVVRISTNPRVFATPSSLKDAFRFCGYLLGFRQVAEVNPGAAHWVIFSRLCTSLDVRGRAVTDVWFAALAIEGGYEWVTFDRDFKRFPGLKWRTP